MSGVSDLPWHADAKLDPWVVVPLEDDVRVLFGYALFHPVTGGLSWLRTSPVRELNAQLGRAETESGRRYDLGQAVNIDRVPSLGEEAWMAFDVLLGVETDWELVPRISADPDRDGVWVASQKAARHLGVAPPSRVPEEVDQFVKRYQWAYQRLRQAQKDRGR